jgi:hypothetical protein
MNPIVPSIMRMLLLKPRARPPPWEATAPAQLSQAYPLRARRASTGSERTILWKSLFTALYEPTSGPFQWYRAK